MKLKTITRDQLYQAVEYLESKLKKAEGPEGVNFKKLTQVMKGQPKLRQEAVFEYFKAKRSILNPEEDVPFRRLLSDQAPLVSEMFRNYNIGSIATSRYEGSYASAFRDGDDKLTTKELNRATRDALCIAMLAGTFSQPKKS